MCLTVMTWLYVTAAPSFLLTLMRCGVAVQVADIEAAEKDKMREKVQKIIGHGVDCFINRQLIYNFPEEIFADAGGTLP